MLFFFPTLPATINLKDGSFECGTGAMPCSVAQGVQVMKYVVRLELSLANEGRISGTAGLLFLPFADTSIDLFVVHEFDVQISLCKN